MSSFNLESGRPLQRPRPLFLALVAGNGSGDGFLMHWQLASRETLTDTELANHTQSDHEWIALELESSEAPIFDALEADLGVGVVLGLFTMFWERGPYEYPEDGENVIELVASKPIYTLSPEPDLSPYLMDWTEGLKVMNEWNEKAEATGRPLRKPEEIEKAIEALFPDEGDDFESATWHMMNT